jgi:hypothetical protein
MNSNFLNYQIHLKKNYPVLPDSIIQSLSPQLASPLTLPLSKKNFTQAQQIVEDIHRLQQLPSYQRKILNTFPFASTTFQKTPSVLCSLDVHVHEHDELKIIEINTNASSFLVNAEHYETRKIPLFTEAKKQLRESFQKTFSEALKPGNLFLIIDENPEQQNMYFEFLMYKEFIQNEFKVRCEIADPKDLTLNSQNQILWRSQPVAGIYNRYCDFYLAENQSLASAFANSSTLISPNPWGYALFADKNRLVDWNDSFFSELSTKENQHFPALQKALLKTYRFSDFKDADDLWSQRNRFFFKPPNAYGSRSVYKGKSISRTVFQRIFTDGYIAQEAVPAPEFQQSYEGQELTFKYDLRFYFFENKVHLAVARLYQGQVTNLQTPLGGLTPLEII